MPDDKNLQPPPSIPPKKIAEQIEKLAALPQGAEPAPRGHIGPGAPMSEEDVKALEDAQAGLKDVQEKYEAAVKAVREKNRARKEGDPVTTLDNGAKLAPDHKKVLERLPVEKLAREAGYLPQKWPSPMDRRNGRPRAVAPRMNPRFWLFAGAKAYYRWPEGKEMTRAEFARAIRTAHTHPIR